MTSTYTTSPGAARTVTPEAEIFHYCQKHPHASFCADQPSLYQYHIWLAPNVVFTAFFALSLAAFLISYIVTRRGLAFALAFILGLTCEIIGYVGRIVNWNNPWNKPGFYAQICCITIGPAFMAAGIYLCLRRIVTAFGPENSRIPPAYYTRIFIPWDVLSLLLQAIGGALASEALGSNGKKSATTGTNIMIAGLVSQVATLSVFVLTSIDFAIRTYRRHRLHGDAALSQRPDLVAMRATRRFRLFLFALGTSAILVLWRSGFRVAELCQGWKGPIIGNQVLFTCFEGILISLACLVLNLASPAFCAGPLFDGAGGLSGLWFTKRRQQRGHELKDLTEHPLSTPDNSY